MYFCPEVKSCVFTIGHYRVPQFFVYYSCKTSPYLQNRTRSFIQGHPTNLLLTLSVPHRNLAGWQYIRCSNDLAGKFLIVRGFGWELLTVLAFQAKLAEKLLRLRTTEKKYPFPLPESSDKHLTAGQRDRVCGKNRFCAGFVRLFLRGISKRTDVSTD